MERREDSLRYSRNSHRGDRGAKTLGVGFLSAVADRFGLWGPPGANNVAWGEFSSFASYTRTLSPWAPAALVPVLAWMATVAEIVLGFALLLGARVRWTAILSGVLLTLFGLGMTVGTGVKTALDASVLSAAAAAFALAVLGPGPWSLDWLHTQRGWVAIDMAEAGRSFHWPGCDRQPVGPVGHSEESPRTPVYEEKS